MRICKCCGRLLKEDQFTKKQAICRHCRRNKRMWEKYHITEEQYIQLWKQQGGKCAICGKDVGEHYLDVDHDHDTGVVRGLLCRECNLLLEQIEKYTSQLNEHLQAYLKRGKCDG